MIVTPRLARTGWWLFAVGVLNLAGYVVHCWLIGGFAAGGVGSDGRYYLTTLGKPLAVSREFFMGNLVHHYSAVGGLLLIFAGLWLNERYRRQNPPRR